eukprot:UN08224
MIGYSMFSSSLRYLLWLPFIVLCASSWWPP